MLLQQWQLISTSQILLCSIPSAETDPMRNQLILPCEHLSMSCIWLNGKDHDTADTIAAGKRYFLMQFPGTVDLKERLFPCHVTICY